MHNYAPNRRKTRNTDIVPRVMHTIRKDTDPRREPARVVLGHVHRPWRGHGAAIVFMGLVCENYNKNIIFLFLLHGGTANHPW